MSIAQATMPRPDAATGRASKATGPVLAVATVAMGLMAGLFFAFDVSVMPGLRQGDDRTFVAAMQNINEAIENGLFGLVFVGAFLATGAAALLERRLGLRGAARWTWAALAFYTIALLLTMGVNIPLNNELADAGDPAKITDLAAVRDAFETKWLVANAFRTLTCVAGLGCVGRALFLYGRDSRRGAA